MVPDIMCTAYHPGGVCRRRVGVLGVERVRDWFRGSERDSTQGQSVKAGTKANNGIEPARLGRGCALIGRVVWCASLTFFPTFLALTPPFVGR